MSKQTKFIEMIAPEAIAGAKEYGFLHPSICIAQACHESGFGTSKQAVEAMDYHGLKKNNELLYTDTYYERATEEVTAAKLATLSAEERATAKLLKNGNYDVTHQKSTAWCKFHSLGGAMRGYYMYLKAWTHYNKPIDVFKIKDARECLNQIAKTYATRSTYADQVWKIVEQYGLLKYDEGFVPATSATLLTAKKGDKVTTSKDYKVATSENNAKKGLYAKDSKGADKVYPAGEYYVYKVSGECVNISKNKLTAGGWILP